MPQHLCTYKECLISVINAIKNVSNEETAVQFLEQQRGAGQMG